MTDRPEKNETFPDIPDEMIADLKIIYGSDPDIPSTVDDTIIADARGYLIRKKSRFRPFRWCVPLAAAAGLVIVILSVHDDGESPKRNSVKSMASADRHITVIDAFEVARAIQARKPLRDEWDVNHDGSIDTRDVDVLMTAAVRL